MTDEDENTKQQVEQDFTQTEIKFPELIDNFQDAGWLNSNIKPEAFSVSI